MIAPSEKKVLLTYELPSQLEAIEQLADAVDDALVDHADLCFPINLCLDELITNIILYGLKKAPDRRIQVEISTSAQYLEIQIQDDAPQFDPFTEAPAADLTSNLDEREIGGLGVHLVKKMMTSYETRYNCTGNLTILQKAFA